MGKVFVDVGMSLDGFIAGPNGRLGNPLGGWRHPDSPVALSARPPPFTSAWA